MRNKNGLSSLFSNSGIYIFATIFNSAIPFFLMPILTRYLSPDEYGLVSMYLLLISFVSPFIGISVNIAITRKYFDYDDTGISEFVFNCIIVLIASTLVTGTLFWFFANPISRFSSFPARNLWMIIIHSFSQSIIYILLAILQAKKKPIFYGLFNNAKTLLNVLLSIIFVVSFKFGWEGRVLGQFFSTVLFSIIAIIILVNKKWIKPKIKKEYIIGALSFGLPLVPHALSGSIISMTDRLFITNMIGLTATGIYSVGYQIGSIINLLATSFNTAYVPWLYEKLKKDNHQEKIKIVKYTYLYFAGIILISVLLGVFAPWFLRIFLGKSYHESSVYVIWIAMGYAFNGMYYMVVNYIFYSQRTKILAFVTFTTSILNIILNYVLISRYGAIGAAQATTLVYAVKFIVVWSVSAKIQKMPWSLKENA